MLRYRIDPLWGPAKFTLGVDRAAGFHKGFFFPLVISLPVKRSR